jgi:hypothetical protein
VDIIHMLPQIVIAEWVSPTVVALVICNIIRWAMPTLPAARL